MATDTLNLEAHRNLEADQNLEADRSTEAPSQANSVTPEPVSRDILRPLLTLAQAAAILGKSIRSLERSVTGRWGNKLPEGWQARKIETENGDEWRVVPPPGFRVRQPQTDESRQSQTSAVEADQNNGIEYAVPPRRSVPWRPEYHNLDQPTIVIDRSEEVEHLLRELLTVQKALSEERRLRMEDLRITNHLQSSMRLLEVTNSENNQAKNELENTRKELEELKRRYDELATQPWWKRVFRR